MLPVASVIVWIPATTERGPPGGVMNDYVLSLFSSEVFYVA